MFVRVKLEENGPPKSVIPMLNLVNLFSDIDVGSLLVDLLWDVNISYAYCWVYTLS